HRGRCRASPYTWSSGQPAAPGHTRSRRSAPKPHLQRRLPDKSGSMSALQGVANPGEGGVGVLEHVVRAVREEDVVVDVEGFDANVVNDESRTGDDDGDVVPAKHLDACRQIARNGVGEPLTEIPDRASGSPGP